MSKFHFRLTTLRKLREAHRDEMQAKLGEALQAEQMLKQQLEEVHGELESWQNSRRETLEDDQTNVNQLLEIQRYQSVLRAQLSTMQGQVQLLAAEVERRRQTLAEANREVRVLDKLEERQFAAHQLKLQQAEVKALDEIASRQAGVNDSWA